ncbi:MAG: DNA gyrase/topoisomerase IV subunit A, partial [Bacteroidota bacterium]
DRTIYNMVYKDGKKGNYMVKRFPVMGITRDKEYSLTRGNDGSKIHYFSANPNGEAEVVKVVLRPNPKLKITSFEYDFSELAIKGRGSYGNILSRKPVKSIIKKEEGVSTLGAREIWFDDTVKRLNVAERGTSLGAFLGGDKILTISSSGYFRHHNFDLSTHFDEDMIHIEKSDDNKVMTAVFYDGAQEYVYMKRFRLEESEKKVSFIGSHPNSKLLAYSLDYLPVIQIKFDSSGNAKKVDDLTIESADFIAVKGYKARGKRLSTHKIKTVKFLAPLPYSPPEEEIKEDAGTEKSAVTAKKSKDSGKTQDEAAEDIQDKQKDDDSQTKLDL